MTYEQLIKHYGSQAEAARALRLSQPTVWAWKKKSIPFYRQYEIERVTRGALSAKFEDDKRNTRRRLKVERATA